MATSSGRPRFPVREMVTLLLLGGVGVPLSAEVRAISGGLTPSGSASTLPIQSEDRSPLETILQAIRAVESGESGEMDAWRGVVETGAPASDPDRLMERRLAQLGLASAAWASHRYPEVEGYLEEILQDSARLTPVTPFAWVVHGEALAAQARLRQADSAFSVATQRAERLGTPRARAWGLIRLANVRGRLTGNAGEAAYLLVQAKSLLPSREGPSPRVEDLLSPEDAFLMGQFHCIRGGNDPDGGWSAEEDARAGMAYARTAGIRRLHAACLHVLASDQIRRGRTTEALETFREEQAEQKAIGDRAGRAATLQWAGYVLFTLGDYATSRAYLMEAVSEGEASGNLSPVAWAYLSLSGIAQGLGDLVAARAYLDRAEALLKDQGDQWGLLTMRGRRGSLAFASGRLEESRRIFTDVLEQNLQSRNSVGALSTMTSLLELALAEENLEAADSLLVRARTMASGGGMGAWSVALFFHEAEIALKRGDPQGAERALVRFLATGQFTVRTYRAQVRYAEALAMEGKEAEAADYLDRALDALEEWRSGLDPTGLQRYAFQIGEYLPDPDLGVATVVGAVAEAGLVEEAFDLAERQTARNLYDRMVLAEIGRPRGLSEGEPGAPPPPSSRPMTAREILPEIRDPSLALIEFFSGRGGEPTTAFVLSQDQIQAVVLPPVDSLQRDIVLLRTLVETAGDHAAVAQRLGRSLMGPVLSRVPQEVSNLVLVPSGSLHEVPFDLLRPADQGPLILAYSLTSVPSASVLIRLGKQGNPLPSSLLALADPTLPDPPSLHRGRSEPDGDGVVQGPGQEGGQAWEPLPGAAHEGRVVARFGNPADLKAGGEASEAFLKGARLEEYGIVHLATHAQVDPASPAGTFLVLAPGEDEDGLLFPGDIASMRFGPSLVVLSSCRTASGTLIRGEGIQGLTAALLRAGARTVVATGWPIEDRETGPLIEAFYRELAGGASAGAALRRAKIAAMEKGEPAKVWAAFTLVGDPTSQVVGLRPGNRLPGSIFTWIAGCVILFWGLWEVRRRHPFRNREGAEF